MNESTDIQAQVPGQEVVPSQTKGQAATDRHRPILVRECLENMQVRAGGTYADLTLGEGGHTEQILALKPALVVAQDQDIEALEKYRAQGAERANPALSLRHGTIRSFVDDPANLGKFDAILADLGVSTFQLLRSGRGFSFQKPEPLDMRMNTSDGETLGEMLETVDEQELANALFRTADMRQSRVYARRILAAHKSGEVKTTEDLARIAHGIEGPRKPGRAHPATVLFLALRMWVNHEYEEVAEGVPALLSCVKPGGRVAILTFHSVEDRLVKHAFQRLAGRRAPEGETEFYASEASAHAVAKLVTTKPIVASEDETRTNPRARSAKLRCIERRS